MKQLLWLFIVLYLVGSVMGQMGSPQTESEAITKAKIPTTVKDVTLNNINNPPVFTAINQNPLSVAKMTSAQLNKLTPQNLNSLQTKSLTKEQVKGMTPDKFKEFTAEQVGKMDKSVLNELGKEKLDQIQDDQNKMNKVVEKDLDANSATANEFPNTKKAGEALKKAPGKVNNLKGSKVSELAQSKHLPQDAVDQLDLKKGIKDKTWTKNDVLSFQKSAKENEYKFEDELGQANRDILNQVNNMDNPSNTGPSNPENGQGPPEGAKPQGGGESAGSGKQQQQGGQEGGKQQGDPLESLSKMLGVVQQILGIKQALAQEDKQKEPQKDVVVPGTQRAEQSTCAKAGGVSCAPPNAKECSPPQTASVADTRQCCVGGSKCVDLKGTPQGQNAQSDIATAKAADATQLAFKLAGQKGEQITSLDQSTKQDMTLLNQQSDKVIPTNDKIYVVNGQATNLYTLKNTQRGVEDFYGIFILDNTGEMKISVGEEWGATTMDPTGIFLWELPGTTVYDAVKDTYETDTRVFSLQHGMWIKAVEKKQAPVTGSFTFAFPTTSVSFGHGALSDLLKNAIDSSITARGDVDVIVMTKGVEDLDLLGNIGFFPIMIRNVAKGSTNIIYDLGVGVEKRYLIKDAQYEYKVVKEDETTKVKAKNGKIIEDSGGMPLRTLSTKQKKLVYE